MEYKVGQKFRIKTFEEVKRDYPDYSWDEVFFQRYAHKVFVIERIDIEDSSNYDFDNNKTLFGSDSNGNDLRLRTKLGEDRVLKPLGLIELENNLFDL